MEEFDQTDIVSSELVTEFIQEYGKYVLATKMPSLIDGLKQVQRYAIWAVHQLSDKTKATTIIGEIAKRHPHGDQSIGDTVVRLGQPHNTFLPLIDVLGNVGTYAGFRPAHSRYLDVKPSDFTKEVFFNGVDQDTLHMVYNDLSKTKEPVYYIPKIPMALLTGAYTLAVGFKAHFPILHLDDLTQLTIDFIKLKQQQATRQYMQKRLAKYINIETFIPTVLRNRDAMQKEFKETGVVPAAMLDGILTISPTSISLVAVPPIREQIHDIYLRLLKRMQHKDPWLIQNFSEITNRSTLRNISKSGEISMNNLPEFRFTLKRGVSPFDVLDKFKTLVRFSRPLHYSAIGLDKQNIVHTVSVIDILEFWYQARYQSVVASLKIKQNKLITEYRMITTMLLIKDHEDAIIGILRSSRNIPSVINKLKRQFNISETEAKYIVKMNISVIIRSEKTALVKRKQEIEQQQRTLIRQFGHTDELLIKDVKKVQARFNNIPRKCRIPNYNGYVIINNKGVILFSSKEELNSIIEAFNKQIVDIRSYEIHSDIIYHTPEGLKIVKNINMLPHEFSTDYIAYGFGHVHYTVKLENGYAAIVPKVQYSTDGQLFHLASVVLGVMKNGQIKKIDLRQLPHVGNIQRRGNKSSLVYLCPQRANLYIAIYGNEKHPGTITCSLVDDDIRLRFIMYGKNIMLSMQPADQSMFISIPKSLQKRGSVSQLHILNPLSLFTKEFQKQHPNLYTAIYKNHVQLSLLSRKYHGVIPTIK